MTVLVRLNVLMERTLTDIDQSLIDPAMDEASHAAVCGPGRCCKDAGLHRDYCKKGDRSCVRKGREALNLSRGEIMGLNVELLKQSFKLVASQAGALVSPFHERFVQEDQAVKPLFKDASMAEQKLQAFFRLVIKNLRKPEKLAERLKAMGSCHVGYGALLAPCDAVGESLVAVLAEFASPSCQRAATALAQPNLIIIGTTSDTIITGGANYVDLVWE